MKLVVELPTKDSPGFLRRSRAAIAFQREMEGGVVTLEVIDEMIDFLLPMVKEPIDRNEAHECLLDASQTQFEEMMSALVGQANPTKPESLPSSTPPVPDSPPTGT